MRTRHIESSRYGGTYIIGIYSIEAYSSKILGIHLDRGLTLDNLIDHVCDKLSSGVYVLRSLVKYCPSQVLITAYYVLIYPHLSCGILLSGACANNHFRTLCFCLNVSQTYDETNMNVRQEAEITTVRRWTDRWFIKSSVKNVKLTYSIMCCLELAKKDRRNRKRAPPKLGAK
ncbi:hypothetical protein J6590_094951 [Homalodisca vitripennis]|nr:hypothetical protein J6590_094951 [Homalodisca vitripennis]